MRKIIIITIILLIQQNCFSKKAERSPYDGFVSGHVCTPVDTIFYETLIKCINSRSIPNDEINEKATIPRYQIKLFNVDDSDFDKNATKESWAYRYLSVSPIILDCYIDWDDPKVYSITFENTEFIFTKLHADLFHISGEKKNVYRTNITSGTEEILYVPRVAYFEHKDGSVIPIDEDNTYNKDIRFIEE